MPYFPFSWIFPAPAPVAIDEKATEVTSHWSMYGGESRNGATSQVLSIFRGDTSLEETTLWKRTSPLEKAAKNLMLLRHPSILKYVSSWTKGEFNLTTEHAKPLHLCLKSHNAIQICLGLRSVLHAVTFLVETANVHHLNLCMPSIYVADDGAWKLFGFEFLFQPNELTEEFLESSQRHRYQKAISDQEVKTKGVNLDHYAFAVLCKDIFTMHPQAEAPLLEEFQDFCRVNLELAAPEERPKLSTILSHAYFNQEFMKVHEFLSQISLKDSFEKQAFFTDLVRKLKTFDERDVAIHLGDLLLSRLVLLDETASMCVTPFVLDPKSDELVPGLFTLPTFTQFIIPKLRKIFMVHDAQIRMILLEHFNKFMSLFPENELRSVILPQLLLGIKDTNDHLVSMTLRCLADLVPILGASVVIGKNRNKIFSDGRPQRTAGDVTTSMTRHWPEARSITPVMEAADDGMELCQQSFADLSTENLMPVRLAPDGGEDVGVAATRRDTPSPTLDTEQADDERWSDWEEEEVKKEGEEEVVNGGELKTLLGEEPVITRPNIPSLTVTANGVADNLTALDIQVKVKSVDDEMDFFKDMEPVIEKREVNFFSEPEVKQQEIPVVEKTASRLTLQATAAVNGAAGGAEEEEGGWGDSDWE